MGLGPGVVGVGRGLGVVGVGRTCACGLESAGLIPYNIRTSRTMNTETPSRLAGTDVDIVFTPGIPGTNTRSASFHPEQGKLASLSPLLGAPRPRAAASRRRVRLAPGPCRKGSTSREIPLLYRSRGTCEQKPPSSPACRDRLDGRPLDGPIRGCNPSDDLQRAARSRLCSDRHSLPSARHRRSEALGQRPDQLPTRLDLTPTERSPERLPRSDRAS